MAVAMGDHREFIGKLVRGESPAASPAELDALLHWLAGRRNDAAASIENAFNARRVSSKAARRQTLLYLDSTLFRHRGDYYRLFGLTPRCGLSEIRGRHKQLLQIFHPDRHAEDVEWFTSRTELLNKAFAHLKATHNKPAATTSASPNVHSPRQGTRASRTARTGSSTPGRGRQAFRVDKGKLRRKLKGYLGSSAAFERRLYVILFGVPAILLTVIYFNQQAADKHERVPLSNAPDAAGSAARAAARVDIRGIDGMPESTIAADVPEEIKELPDEVSVPETTRDGMDRSPSAARAQPDGVSGTGRAAVERQGKERPMSPKPAARPVAARTTYQTVDPFPSELDMLRSGRANEPVPEQSEAAASSMPVYGPIPDIATTYNGVPARSSSASPGDRSASDDVSEAEPAEDTSWTYASKDRSTFTASSTEEDRRDRVMAVKALLDQYQTAYNVSNINRLSELFHQDAVTGHSQGKPEIEENFLAAFRNTDQRKLVIKEPRIGYLGDQRFRVSASYVIDRTYPGGEQERQAGELRMHLVMVDDVVKIQRLEY